MMYLDTNRAFGRDFLAARRRVRSYPRTASPGWVLASAFYTVLLAAVAPAAWAQTAARVDGFVTDPSGAIVLSASVTLRNEVSGTEIRGVTDTSGLYNFEFVPAATYTLTVQKTGFKTYVRSGIVVHPSDRLEISVNLELGSEVQTVEVSGQAENVPVKDSGAKIDVITGREVQNLTAINRSALELLTILPGVVNTSFNANSGSSFSHGGNTFNINGMRNDQHEFRMDNGYMTNQGGDSVIMEPNMDVIAELSVKTSNVGADQSGRPTTIDVITKSGGNHFHGDLYWYTRNAKFNANDFSNNLAGIPKPNSLFNYPGFNIGGPVLIPGTTFNKNRDKMFFFFAAELQHQRPDPGTELAVVPTAQQRGGDFSDLLNPTFCTTDASGKITGGRYLQQPCLLTDPITGAALSGNKIPASEIPDQFMKSYLSLFPLPSYVDPNGVNNFAGRPLRPLNRHEELLRVDYNLNQTTRMFIRLGHQTEKQYWDFGLWSGENSGWTSNIPEPTPTIGQNFSRSLAVNIVKIINPTLTNESQFSASALNLDNRYQDASVLSKAAIGFNFTGLFNTGSLTVPQITDNAASPGAARFGAGNLASKVFANYTTLEYMDNLTKMLGRHTLKFGFLAQRARFDENNGNDIEGRLSTDESFGQTTGDEFGDILTQRFKGFDQFSKDPEALLRFWNVESYGQDSWKPHRRWTLNFGIRFAWLQHWYETRGLAVTFDPQVYDPKQPTNLLNGLLQARKGEIPKGIVPSTGPVYEPRFGFAWDIFGTGRSVLRGGFGVYSEPESDNTIISFLSAPPDTYDSAPSPTTADQFFTLAQIEAIDPLTSIGNLGFKPINRHDTHKGHFYQWSLTWSQQLGSKTVLEASYLANSSRHLFALHDINAVQPGAMWVPGTQVLGSDLNNQDFRRYKPWGSLNWADQSLTANYNSLQVTARRNVAKGLTFFANYTWSKALGYSPDIYSNVDPFDRRRNYGLLSYDRAHIFNVAYIYQLPSLAERRFHSNRIAKGVLDSWQLSGTTHYVSGPPVGISVGGINCTLNPNENNLATQGLCSSNLFTADGRTWYGTGDLPVQSIVVSNPRSGAHFAGLNGTWLNQASASLPTIGQYGTFEQPTMRAPAFNDWDLTLFKDFPLGESRRLQFRIAAFDLFNRAQLDSPQTTANFNWVLPLHAASLSQGTAQLANPDTFGRILDKHGHREMEFAIKFYF